MANSDKKHEPESDLKRQIQNKKQSFQQEQKVANHIAYWIVGILVILLLILGVLGYNFVQESLQPFDRSDHQEVVLLINKLHRNYKRKKLSAVLLSLIIMLSRIIIQIFKRDTIRLNLP